MKEELMQRRIVLKATLAIAGLGLTACSTAPTNEPSKVSASAKPVTGGLLLAGSSTDKGFMQSGFDGLKRAEKELGIALTVLEGIKPEQADLEAGLRKLAKASPDLIVAHGGQNAKTATNVAGEFPQIMFVVTQSDVGGPNLSSYEVLQEESAWLAGAAAGLLTKTNTVGHMSGIRVTPGLRDVSVASLWDPYSVLPAVFEAEHGCLCASLESELTEHAGNVVLDCFLCQVQALAYFTVRESLRE